VDSTNDYALRRLASLPDRHIVAAEIQTGGKGRLDRSWVSTFPGNIYVSFVLKPEGRGPCPLASISQYLALVVCEILEGRKVRPSLKWPNDVLVGDRKIAGILAQSNFFGDRLEGLVLGVGINLNLEDQDLRSIGRPAASLNLLTGAPVDRDRFLEELAARFFGGYDDFLAEGFPSIIEAYQARCLFLGKPIRVVLPDREVMGTALGFSEDGRLILENGLGRKEIISAGDVRLARELEPLSTA